MAERETTSTGNNIDAGENGLVLADGVAILSKERTDVALQAIYQIDALSRHLAIAADMDTQPAEFAHVLKNLGARISGLSNALCGALDDDRETMESLSKRICL
jgi:hypothetical protein